MDAIVFTKSNCGQCEVVKQKLNDFGVDYSIKSLDSGVSELYEMIKQSSTPDVVPRSAPVILYKGKGADTYNVILDGNVMPLIRC